MYQESVKETAREMAKQGLTIMQIAARLGAKRGTAASWVVGYCKRAGYPKEVKEKAKNLAEQGLSRSQKASVRQICQKLHSEVLHALELAKLPPPLPPYEER